MQANRCLAIGRFAHYIEHLAPVCDMAAVTLFVPSEQLYRYTRRYFPFLNIIDVVPQHEHAALFYSHLYEGEALQGLKQHFRARRVFHCPHGFSEKRQAWAMRTASQEAALLYGRSALDQLEDLGVGGQLTNYLLVGDLRRRFYERHKGWFDELVRSRLPQNVSTLNILYAPTWGDGTNASSFMAALSLLINHLPRDMRLIIKLHPHLKREVATLKNLEELASGNDRLFFFTDEPFTFPLFSLADVYLGDLSALAYEFLYEAKPMVFLNQACETPTDGTGSMLFECGPVIPPNDYPRIYTFLEAAIAQDAMYRQRRRDLYEYVYSNVVPYEQIRESLLHMIAQP